MENPTTLQEVPEQNGWSESQMQESAASVQTVNASVPGSNANAADADGANAGQAAPGTTNIAN